MQSSTTTKSIRYQMFLVEEIIIEKWWHCFIDTFILLFGCFPKKYNIWIIIEHTTLYKIQDIQHSMEIDLLMFGGKEWRYFNSCRISIPSLYIGYLVYWQTLLTFAMPIITQDKRISWKITEGYPSKLQHFCCALCISSIYIQVFK